MCIQIEKRRKGAFKFVIAERNYFEGTFILFSPKERIPFPFPLNNQMNSISAPTPKLSFRKDRFCDRYCLLLENNFTFILE